ncbi:MAG: AAA family ATPase [Synechococcus sp. SB0666_bin_14]|nr:AAA family ATPase [Synechococcus sp. SB0666_bin_14]MYA91349.1 AAA family ATPase [Synechococcus sp. SB0663_bin_10]MYG47395.1 AAA family ATPase [Synechococcus sp. SB0675_bin_6]MYK91454.1 AAA family ATPase [Synechococcus sp. SB0669_bin_8]
MLHRLHLKNVGPAPELALDPLALRLNLITGDNGLGKSFLLDVAWYCLTRRWPQEVNPGLTNGAMALPRDRKQTATLTFTVDGEQRQESEYACRFDLEEETWLGNAGRPVNPGLVLYAMADGSFALWDPARNAWKRKGNSDAPEKIKAYVFSNQEVWRGKVNAADERNWLCNGLIRDWANWQRENGEAFAQLKQVLEVLSPEPHMLKPGPLQRLRRDDATDYPTIIGADEVPVPVAHGSSGVRRILALAYLLVWAWQEHQRASELLAKPPSRQMIFLIDEVEAHLHPSWQRRVVRALLQVVQGLHRQTTVQLLLVTHSPLVMASVEPHFDPNQDRWWDLDLNPETRRVELIPQHFERLGDANSWLRSEAFHQDDTGSLEREEILRAARRAIRQIERGEAVDSQEVQRLEQELQKVLGSTDPFWSRWRFAERQGGQRP